jgi:hypothetical protein
MRAAAMNEEEKRIAFISSLIAAALIPATIAVLGQFREEARNPRRG